MKALPWIVAGAAIGAAYVLLNQPAPRYAAGSDDVDDAANNLSFWGTKKRFSGIGGGFVGKAKQGIGRATGDDRLATEGVVDEFAGAVKDGVGKAAHAVSGSLKDLNQ